MLAEVKEYKLEIRDADKRAWHEVARCRETSYEARNCGMELDHDYVFRVTAYNAGGESETSEPSDAITAMERFVKPRLDKDLLGKEKEGVPVELLDLVDICVEIPQHGLIRSLNVHVTGALVVWEYVKQQNNAN